MAQVQISMYVSSIHYVIYISVSGLLLIIAGLDEWFTYAAVMNFLIQNPRTRSHVVRDSTDQPWASLFVTGPYGPRGLRRQGCLLSLASITLRREESRKGKASHVVSPSRLIRLISNFTSLDKRESGRG